MIEDFFKKRDRESTEVATNNAMPSLPVLLIKFLLDVLGNFLSYCVLLRSLFPQTREEAKIKGRECGGEKQRFSRTPTPTTEIKGQNAKKKKIERKCRRIENNELECIRSDGKAYSPGAIDGVDTHLLAHVDALDEDFGRRRRVSRRSDAALALLCHLR